MIRPMNRTHDDTDTVLPDIVKAAYAADSALVAKLLELGHDVNSVDPRDNLSLLHIACLQGDEALADVILAREELQGDVDFSTVSNYRPRQAWQYAANGNHLALAERVHEAEVAKALKRHGPKPISWSRSPD